MTEQEFNETKWTGQMKCEINGKVCDVAVVDFEFQAVGVEDEGGDVEFHKYDKVKLIEEK